MIEIETGIPIPRKLSVRSKYPWDSLRVDQSFFIASQNTNTFSLSYARKSRSPKDFTARNVEYKGEKGIRIWRIK